MQDSSVLYSPDVDADPGRDPGPPHSVGSLNQFPFMGAAIMQIVVGWALDAYPGSPETGYSQEAYGVMLSILFGSVVVGWVAALFMKETFPRGRG